MQKAFPHLLVTSFNLLISLVVLLIVLAVAFDLPWLPSRPDPGPQVSNLSLMITTTPAPPAEPDEDVMNTAVAVAFNLFVQTQEAGSTPTPVMTNISTPLIEMTPTPLVLASQTAVGAGNPARTTTDLAVDITKMSQFRFKVPRDRSLYLRDTSRDRKANSCTISRSGFKISVTMPASGAPSAAFQLPAGDYRLKCTGSNKSARITSS